MPSALPPGDPAPPRRAAAGGGAGGAGEQPVRALRARARSAGPVRLLRLQHLHRQELGDAPARPGRRTPRPPSPSCAWPGGCWVSATCRCPRSSSAGVRRRCCRRPTWPRSCAPSTPSSGWRRDAEVTTESNPDSVHGRRPGRAARGRLHPDLLRDAVGRPARAGHPRPHPRPAPGPGGRGVGAGGRLRAGQPRPDLRHAGGVAGGLGDLGRRGARCAARPRVGVRADRRGGHGARPRRIKRGELPLPDDDDLADKYLLADERFAAAGLEWYEVSNWARDDGEPVPAQPPLLDRRRLVGRRTRGALPRRRGALVERQAPRGVRRAARGGRQPGARARGARQRDPAGGAGAARDAPGRRACPATCSTPRARRPCTTSSRAGCSSPAPPMRAGWC